MTFGKEELYPTIVAKASAIGFALIKNHPFLDGNIRNPVSLINRVSLYFTYLKNAVKYSIELRTVLCLKEQISNP
jgi:prophage maintenance system killer protein